MTGAASAQTLLAGIYAVDSLDEALALRKQLAPGESIVTRDGIWLGANWLRVSRRGDATSGMLERKQELEELAATIAEQEQLIDSLSEASERGRGRTGGSGAPARREQPRNE